VRKRQLADGWNGRIIKNQTYFNVLDGLAITIVMWTGNVFSSWVADSSIAADGG
jgi:hypothetical protein